MSKFSNIKQKEINKISRMEWNAKSQPHVAGSIEAAKVLVGQAVAPGGKHFLLFAHTRIVM